MTKTEHFSQRVLDWFDQHGRKNLPWQQGINPYRVWISEIMLQQTQVATVIPYFETFMQRFPTVEDLAQAEEDDVLHLWSGLGYYSRARNLHKTAQRVVLTHNGQFPQSVDELATLPGIGRSTAGAIASISMGIKAPILDGNVKRVLARYQMIAGWPSQSTNLKRFWEAANNFMPDHRFGDYAQAMMDLGATICTRTRPSCLLCPLQASCAAHMAGKELEYPEKKPKKQKPEQSVAMLMMLNQHGKILLKKRPSSGIWGGLWGFPEEQPEENMKQIISKKYGMKADCVEIWQPFRHTFSHYHLNITPVRALVSLNAKTSDNDTWCWYDITKPAKIGLAAPVTELIKKIQLGCSSIISEALST